MSRTRSNFLMVAFFIYIVALVIFSLTLSFEKKKDVTKSKKWGRVGFTVASVGFLSQLGYFITRWMAGGHAPVSNMFEYI